MYLLNFYKNSLIIIQALKTYGKSSKVPLIIKLPSIIENILWYINEVGTKYPGFFLFSDGTLFN